MCVKGIIVSFVIVLYLTNNFLQTLIIRGYKCIEIMLRTKAKKKMLFGKIQSLSHTVEYCICSIKKMSGQLGPHIKLMYL